MSMGGPQRKQCCLNDLLIYVLIGGIQRCFVVDVNVLHGGRGPVSHEARLQTGISRPLLTARAGLLVARSLVILTPS